MINGNLKKYVMSNVMTALHHIENAHTVLTKFLEDEKALNERDRNALYDYGMGDVDIHKVRLANIKKSILAITNNHRLAKE